ncbi:MAG: 23S rRNA (uracil(1939)-C(5))-methyltransferase RlmD [Patescibacteria group bacterium]
MKVEIEKMGFAGSGIGHLPDGRIVFIKKTVPGDIVEIELLDDKKDFAFGKVNKLIKPSDDRIEPDCPYFYSCGGCEHQNIPYCKQLEIKQSLIDESLRRNGIEANAEKIIPGSSKLFFYRNSIRFMFDLDSNNQLKIARHAYPDDRKLVQVDKCLLQSETSNLIAKTIIDFVNANVSSKKSFWQLKIREGKKTTEFMIEIITSSHDLTGEKGIIENLKSIEGVKSIYHTIAPAKSLLNLKRRLIFGSPVVYEKIGRYTFQISPESFFQTNSEGVKTLYDKIKEFANIEIGDEIIDLYCGTGSIGIYLSTLAKKVIGIEVVPAAIRDANDNARINKIKNIEFICSNINSLAIQQYNNCIIIVDPPRAGLSKELIQKLSDVKWKRLIYVSCNPATFARDLRLFMEKGIIATKIQPIDMFPQTHHTELVAELKKSR